MAGAGCDREQSETAGAWARPVQGFEQSEAQADCDEKDTPSQRCKAALPSIVLQQFCEERRRYAFLEHAITSDYLEHRFECDGDANEQCDGDKHLFGEEQFHEVFLVEVVGYGDTAFWRPSAGFEQIDTLMRATVAVEMLATKPAQRVSIEVMASARTYTDDCDLVNAVLNGESGAFERLVREHQTLCWHIVLKLVRDPEDARDVCQDAFLRVHRYLDQYRFDSALRTWIGRIAYTAALRYLERRRNASLENMLYSDPDFAGDDRSDAFDSYASDEDVQARAGQSQIDALVRRHMERLPPIQSLLLTLYHLDELTIPEISATTGLPSGTIKSHLARARARLRDTLAITLGERP